MSTTSPSLGTPLRRAVPVPLPTLRLLPVPARQASRTTFVVVLLACLGVGLAGVLVLTTMLQQRAFQLYDLEAELAAAQEQRAILITQLAGRDSPAALERAARGLGMVPAPGTLFLDVRTGTASGDGVPALPATAEPR